MSKETDNNLVSKRVKEWENTDKEIATNKLERKNRENEVIWTQ